MEEPNQTNELHEAFTTMFKAGTKPSLIRLLRGLIPGTQYLVRTTINPKFYETKIKQPADRDRETEKAKETMDRIGKQLLSARKLALDSQQPDKMATQGNDILSLLVRANASEASHQRLSDEHALARESGP